MSIFNPSKLFVSYKNNVPIKTDELPRRYTLTHSDETGELFLTIGKEYDYDKLGPMKDEVLAEWSNYGDEKVLEAFVRVDGDYGLAETIIRDKIFRRELPLALTAILYGDGLFIDNNPSLKEAKIKVNFKSKYPEYNIVEDFGSVEEYKYNEVRIQNNPNSGGYYPIPYPYPPIPPVIPIPLPKPNQKTIIKHKIIEDVLVTMLDPYIKKEVNLKFGKKTHYCLKKVEILNAVVVNKNDQCTNDYEIIIGIRVGKNPPPYNNLIISFFINDNIVKVIDVKMPRDNDD